GVPQAVATCGTALTEDHFKVLGRFARRVVLAFDADSAGQSAAERIYEWERRNEIEVAVASLPPGSDPAELAESDPAGLNKAVETALPFLSFRLERALRPERLHSAESRAKAAEDGVEMIAEHPNELVRDQYVMVVSDRTMIESDRLRERVERARRTRAARVSKGAGGGGQAAGGRAGSGQTGSGQTGSGQTGSGQAVPGPGESARVQETNALSARRGPAPGRRAGRDALVLAIHDRSSMQGRLGAALFSDPVQRRAFAALDEASDLHSALEIADDEAADLLRQLAVGEPSADSDQTIVALARSAATASLRELEGRARQAEAVSDKEGLSEAAAMIRWLKQELEAMAEPGVNDLPPRDVIEAADRLVAWLSARGGEPT
ncbi:MAG: toprim domain-containing protein, partial [Acidimicrobiales bacterium]